MMSLVDLFKAIERHVGIDLSGGYIGVSQNGLNRSEIGAVADHVRGTTVAEHVRTRLAVQL